MKRICVYCGSSPGRVPEYGVAARELGACLAQDGLELVYGGADVGLMGELANAVLAGGGHVIGVIPHGLAERVGHKALSECYVVDSMHERKTLMAELADGFIALPGGMGTLEEVFEILTWAQLGYHDKPCGLLNVQGYYDQLLAFLAHSVEERFVAAEHCEILQVGSSPDELLAKLRAYIPNRREKWL
jgi:uncharacterized protein (TIGR00730 family)